jgi:hypothetical protein
MKSMTPRLLKALALMAVFVANSSFAGERWTVRYDGFGPVTVGGSLFGSKPKTEK